MVGRFTAVKNPNWPPYLGNTSLFQTKSQRQMTSSLMVQLWSMHCHPKGLRHLQTIQLLTFCQGLVPMPCIQDNTCCLWCVKSIKFESRYMVQKRTRGEIKMQGDRKEYHSLKLAKLSEAQWQQVRAVSLLGRQDCPNVCNKLGYCDQGIPSI